MATIVTALFRSRMTAEQAVDSLLRAGFRREDVSVLMSETTHGREFGIVTHNKMGEGAAAGAARKGVGPLTSCPRAAAALPPPGR